MIRCVRMWTGEDGNSLFDEGTIALGEGERGDAIGKPSNARSISFRETASGGSFEWHQDPEPRYVITIAGTIEIGYPLHSSAACGRPGSTRDRSGRQRKAGT